MHHIVSDGWSLGIFWRELLTAPSTRAFAAGRTTVHAGRAAHPVQPTTSRRWQRALAARAWRRLRARSSRTGAGRAIAGAPARARAAPDRSAAAAAARDALPVRRAVRTFALCRRGRWRCGSREAARAERQGVTPFMTALLAGLPGAAPRIAVTRGQHDVVVGSPIAGRTRPETRSGCWASSSTPWCCASGSPASRHLPRAARARPRDVRSAPTLHQDLPVLSAWCRRW